DLVAALNHSTQLTNVGTAIEIAHIYDKATGDDLKHCTTIIADALDPKRPNSTILLIQIVASKPCKNGDVLLPKLMQLLDDTNCLCRDCAIAALGFVAHRNVQIYNKLLNILRDAAELEASK